MNLRLYQQESITELSRSFANHKRVIFILPTGGGKTVVFSEIAYRAILKGRSVLILTDRIELFTQAAKSISGRNLPICKINADSKNIYPEAKLFIGMVQTVTRRLQSLQFTPDLIICDEAHKGNFFKVFDYWPNSLVIGATATPINKRLHKYYTHMVNVIDIPELVSQSFLSPCKAFQMQDDFSDLKTDKTGEFTDQSLMQHFNKSKLYEGVIDKWLEKCKGQKTVVFNCNIEHSELTTRAFNAAGIKSYCITSKTSDKEREWILSEFSSGSFPVLNNCGILTTGWDEPNLEVVILNRATTSLPLFLQMCGRGSRIYPGKEFFTVLDFGANHDRHGLWCEARNWTLEPPKKKKKPSGVAPVRECKSCGAMLPAQQKKCEFCGHEITDKEKDLLQGQLVEMQPRIPQNIIGKKFSDVNLDDLLEIEKTKQYKSTYIWRILRSRGKDAVEAWAKHKNYKFGWVKNQLEMIEAGDTNFTDLKIREKIILP